MSQNMIGLLNQVAIESSVGIMVQFESGLERVSNQKYIL